MTNYAAAKSEIMARRMTFDGHAVEFWTDGAVTVRAHYVKGCGDARTAEGREQNIKAAWLLVGEVSLYEKSELPKAVQAARKAVRMTGGSAIERFRELMAPPEPKPAKPHAKSCSCPKCFVAHCEHGCRVPGCKVCFQ